MTRPSSIWLFLYLWTFGRYNFCDHGKLGWSHGDYGEIFTKYINKTCDGHAITMLAACYLPGRIIVLLQPLTDCVIRSLGRLPSAH